MNAVREKDSGYFVHVYVTVQKQTQSWDSGQVAHPFVFLLAEPPPGLGTQLVQKATAVGNGLEYTQESSPAWLAT